MLTAVYVFRPLGLLSLIKDKGKEDVKAVPPLSLPFLAQPVGGVQNVDCLRPFLAAMLKEVRWCHAGQVTLCAQPSCHWAEAVPQEFQSVIIILMTCIALLAMSSLVCAKANEQCPNCKINWKTFWLKTTLTTLSFHSSFTDRCSLLQVVLSPILLYQHAPDVTLFFTCNLFFSVIFLVHLYLGKLLLFSCAQPPMPAPPPRPFLCLFPSDSLLCCCLLYFLLTSPLLSVLTASLCLLMHLYAVGHL